MEKWVIVYILPLEVWMDIFCFPWISRKEFGRFIDRIGNFKFAEHAQFYLHEWGKRKLSDVRFDKNGLHKNVGYDYDINRDHLYLDIPQTPMPENIRYLGVIRIDHFDASTIDFLRKIRPLLLTNLLEIDISAFNSLKDFPTIMSNFAPFVDGIHTLECTERTFPMAKQYFGEKLANKIKMLKYWYTYTNDEAENVNLVVNWLLNDSNDGPRMCEAHLRDDDGIEFFEQISAAIPQQFLIAKTPCTFALKMAVNDYDTSFAEFHLENGKGEELHGTWTEVDGEEGFQIVRHPANCNTGMQEWIKQTESESIGIGCIHFWYPTVGSLDPAQLDVPAVDVVDQAEQQQPCSSKDI